MIDTRHAATEPRYRRRQKKLAGRLRSVRFRWGSDSRSILETKKAEQTEKEQRR